jgi:hypothetical protein
MRALLFAILGLVATLGVTSRASAFHTASTFAATPGAGGGGRIFYTGSPREHRWTCAACHVDAPGELRVGLDADHGLLDERSYVPGTTYHVVVTIENERLGLSAARANFNGMVAAFLDDANAPAGDITNAPADQFAVQLRTTVLSASTAVGVTRWEFDWVAPAAGTGAVTLYLGVVDGNGAGSGATETLTDPFGDDVAASSVRLMEAGTTSSVERGMQERVAAHRSIERPRVDDVQEGDVRRSRRRGA